MKKSDLKPAVKKANYEQQKANKNKKENKSKDTKVKSDRT